MQLDFEYALELESTVRLPEQELFFAVVLQAFEDLRPTIWRSDRIRSEAEDWLLNDTHDFYLICQFAAVDADYIRWIARRYVHHLKEGGEAKRIVLRDAE
jgi:hypothetical protein